MGQVKCAAVPASSGARGFATGAACCLLGGITINFVSGAMGIQTASLAGNFIVFVGSCLFCLFMRATARYLGDDELAASVGRYLIFIVCLIVGAFTIGVAAGMGGMPGLVIILALAALVCELIAVVWFLRLIRSLQADIDGTLGRQSIRTGQRREVAL